MFTLTGEQEGGNVKGSKGKRVRSPEGKSGSSENSWKKKLLCLGWGKGERRRDEMSYNI